MTLREIAKRGLFITSRGMGSVLGFFLKPIADILKSGLSVLFSRILFTCLLLVGIATIGGVGYLNAGLLGAIGYGIAAVAIGALLGFGSILIGIETILFQGLKALVVSPISGMKLGWNLGFTPMLKELFLKSHFPTAHINQFRSAFSSIQRMLLHPQSQGARSEMFEQFQDMAIQSQRSPLTLEQFEALSLNELDITALISSAPARLTPEEVDLLAKDTTSQEILKDYKELIALDNAVCAILQDQPDEADKILLVKQYLHENTWLPVPNKTNVFSKSGLQLHLVGTETSRGNDFNPLDRDNILNPSPHEGHRTRYVYHAVIKDVQNQPIYQVLSATIIKLRERLHDLAAYQHPAAENDDDATLSYRPVLGR